MSDRPVSIVTGASRGIGRAIALRLASDGFAVVVNYASSAAAADEVVGAIVAAGGQAIAIGANIALPAGRESLLQMVDERLGRVDVLVNNAGITSQGRKDILEATEESWDAVFDTNLKGPFFLTRDVASRMVRQREAELIPRATIVNISSVSAYAVSTNRADYCMTKAALRMMTWLFADRLAEHNIRVYEVCPGVIASDMTAPVKAKYDQLIADGLSPIRRWGEPEDVAEAVAALVSGLFPFSTGDCLNVDGGFHIRRL